MNNDEMSERLVAVEQRSKSNTKRIDKLEEMQSAILELTIAVKGMVVKQDAMAKSVDRLDKKFDELDNRTEDIQHKPEKKVSEYVEKAIYAAIAILVGYLFSRLGVK